MTPPKDTLICLNITSPEQRAHLPESSLPPPRLLSLHLSAPPTHTCATVPKRTTLRRPLPPGPPSSSIRKTAALTVLCLLPLTACQSSQTPPDVLLHNRLVTLAGPKATDCGRATTQHENVEQSACALQAIEINAPFFVQYRLPSTHSEQGIALDDQGKLTELTVPLSATAATAAARLLVIHCRSAALRTTATGSLSCD